MRMKMSLSAMSHYNPILMRILPDQFKNQDQQDYLQEDHPVPNDYNQMYSNHLRIQYKKVSTRKMR